LSICNIGSALWGSGLVYKVGESCRIVYLIAGPHWRWNRSWQTVAGDFLSTSTPVWTRLNTHLFIRFLGHVFCSMCCL